MSKEKLIKSIREIPDFPIPGILFYDVTTLFKDSERLQELSDIMYEMYKDKGITKVVASNREASLWDRFLPPA